MNSRVKLSARRISAGIAGVLMLVFVLLRFEAVLGIALEIKAEDIETALRRDPAVRKDSLLCRDPGRRVDFPPARPFRASGRAAGPVWPRADYARLCQSPDE